jgi:hypothetical protein
MVAAGNAADGRSFGDRVGQIMRRAIAIAFAAAGLGGCSGLSWDSLKPAPTMVDVQLQSSPPGADAKTSLGPGCKTPCSVSVPAPDTAFSVSFSMDRFQPETVEVQVTRNTGAFNSAPPVVLDPNPVVAELQPAAPPPRAKRMRPRKPRPPKAAAAPAAAPADAAFPTPNAPPRQ